MNKFEELAPEILRDVCSAIHDRAYYLLLGSGVSLDSKGRDGDMLSAGDLTDKLKSIRDERVNFSLPQIYSLLDAEEIVENATNPYLCLHPGPTIERIIKYPWRRVYTFNIDNCFEVAARSWLENLQYNPKLVESIHFRDSFSENVPLHVHSIVHLHGFVERPSDSYVFSYREYAGIMGDANRWMGTLTDIINSAPFIVSGTSLSEIDVEFYLQSRSKNSSQITSLPSILIEPYPNSLTYKLCAEHNFVLFVGNAIQFFDQIEKYACEPPVINLSAFQPTRPITGISDEEILRFEQGFERVPSNPQIDRAPARFLLGAPLSWQMLAGNSDILRDSTEEIERSIAEQRRLSPELRSFVIFDEAGSGKSALLKRLAFRHAGRATSVLWLSDSSFLDTETVARILENLPGQITIYVDDMADYVSYIRQILLDVKSADVLFVGAERSYRRRYIEDQLNVESDFASTKGKALVLRSGEARRLVEAHRTAGVGRVMSREAPGYLRLLKEIGGESVAVANCRIQNNFQKFDAIIDQLIKQVDISAQHFFVIVALGRHGHGAGVKGSIAFRASGSDIGAGVTIDDSEGPLPVVRNPDLAEYLLPGRSIVADRVLSVLRKQSADFVAQCIVDLGRALAPYVIGQERYKRTHESLLASGLLDFDRTVQKFAGNDGAGFVYDQLNDVWSSDSRFREQIALMHFNKFLSDRSNRSALDLAIATARSAEGQRSSNQSKTTLAKILFASFDRASSHSWELFDEALSLVANGIVQESKMKYLSSVPFTVAFRGARDYMNLGFVLTVKQKQRLSDLVSLSLARNLYDPEMKILRDSILSKLV